MTVLTVPSRVYGKALEKAPRSLWAWADIQPGKRYEALLPPWATWEERVRAEEALEELKQAIRKRR